jgi:apolipoprotein N-acyltransferase
LVLWSETSIMRALPVAHASELVRRSFARDLGVPLLFGAVLYRPVDDAREAVFYNSALITDDGGKLVGRYDKQELVPFSEHMPLGEELPVLYEISPNSSKFVPGISDHTLPLGDHRLAAMICNDDVVPALANRLLRDSRTDLLVNLTNDAWFGDTTEPWIHLALSKFRAVEHRRFLVRSTNSGVSAFVDPVGRVVAHTDTFREQTLMHEVAWLRGRTGYEIWGDAPYWVGALLSFFFAARVRAPRARIQKLPL